MGMYRRLHSRDDDEGRKSTSLPALLDELDRRGITVETRPHGNISVRPWKAAPPELRERLSAEKPALSAYLLAREVGATSRARRVGPDSIRRRGRAGLARYSGIGAEHQPGRIHHRDLRAPDIALRLTADGRLALGRSDLCGNESTIPQSLAMAVEAHAHRHLPACLGAQREKAQR